MRKLLSRRNTKYGDPKQMNSLKDIFEKLGLIYVLILASLGLIFIAGLFALLQTFLNNIR